MNWTDLIIEQVASPGKLAGHLSYILLIVSMMMRSMKWLRAIAISAGMVSAVYGYFLGEFVIVFWEVIFVTVNLVQLLLLEFENRRAKFSEHEQKFIAAAVPTVEKAHARRLLHKAEWKEFEVGTVLTNEGEPVDSLLFIVEGAVRVDKDGAMVGVCGHDDFIGEIGFMLSTAATATAVVTHSVAGFVFKHDDLTKLLDKDDSLRHALESSFNRNLVGKLVKSNAGPIIPSLQNPTA